MFKSSMTKSILDDLILFASTKGFLIKSQDRKFFEVPGFTLLPSKIGTNLYDSAKLFQPTMNTVIENMSRDVQYIHSTLQPFTETDEFIKNLVEVSKESHKSKFRQDIHLGIIRSDYMHDTDSNHLKMVEYNTIASSFGSLTQKLCDIHKYISERYEDIFENVPKYIPPYSFIEQAIEAFNQCINIYRNSVSQDSNPHILFVVQDDERNVIDQVTLEHKIYFEKKIPSIRKTLLEIYELGKVDDISGILTIEGKEIGLVYFRAGYTPRDYKNEDKEWKARKLIECSRSIKCPDVDLHLTTFKIFQERFGNPENLKKHIGKGSIEGFNKFLVGFWSLKNPSPFTEEMVKKAKEKPDDFVLKTHREGGGNNYYGESIRTMLETQDKNTLGNMLLMQKIKNKNFQSIFIRNGEAKEVTAMSEYSRFGIFISSSKEIFNSFDAGHLLRTKESHVGEGGVATGYSVLDNPWII